MKLLTYSLLISILFYFSGFFVCLTKIDFELLLYKNNTQIKPVFQFQNVFHCCLRRILC